jgi:hypothetical protein
MSLTQDPSNAAVFTLQGSVPSESSSTKPINVTIKVNSLYGDQAMADRVSRSF